MTKTAATRTYSEEEQDALREQVGQIQEQEDLTKQDVADQSGIKYGTLTSWLGRTYKGNTSRVAAEVERWLNEREARQAAAASFVQSPGWQATPTAETFINTLRYAQVMPDMSLIAGGAGIGKTSAAEQYKTMSPNVHLVTAEPTLTGSNALLSELCIEVGCDEKHPGKLSRALRRKLRGTQALIVVDEAQHLKKEAIEQLRSLHDKAGVGVVLLGNETIYQSIDGAGRSPGYAQLFSRFGKRVHQAKPKKSDVDALLDAWGVSDAEEMKFARTIASKPGALRMLDKALRLASTIAAGANETRGIAHLRHAYKELGALEMHSS